MPKFGEIKIYPKIFFEKFLFNAEIALNVPPVEVEIKSTCWPSIQSFGAKSADPVLSLGIRRDATGDKPRPGQKWES